MVWVKDAVTEFSEIIFFRGQEYLTNIPKFVSTTSKLWMPGPLDRIFQHLLVPKAGPEEGIRNYQTLPALKVVSRYSHNVFS